MARDRRAAHHTGIAAIHLSRTSAGLARSPEVKILTAQGLFCWLCMSAELVGAAPTQGGGICTWRETS